MPRPALDCLFLAVTLASFCAGCVQPKAIGASDFLASTVSEAVMPGGTPWNGYCGLVFYGSMTDCMARSGPLGQR
jgi:hypothetical protein